MEEPARQGRGDSSRVAALLEVMPGLSLGVVSLRKTSLDGWSISWY
jgi:hypothetical protein